MALMTGLHTCYNGYYNEKQKCEFEQIFKNYLKFGLFSAIREHEVGIASNRESACYGEYVLRSCTHRPSHDGNWFYFK